MEAAYAWTQHPSPRTTQEKNALYHIQRELQRNAADQFAMINDWRRSNKPFEAGTLARGSTQARWLLLVFTRPGICVRFLPEQNVKCLALDKLISSNFSGFWHDKNGSFFAPRFLKPRRFFLLTYRVLITIIIIVK
jgi:hypothetical protein